jgi:hypothetical protein
MKGTDMDRMEIENINVLNNHQKGIKMTRTIEVSDETKERYILGDTKTEDYVRNFLKERGFSVNEKDESSKGIDIVAVKNGIAFMIEVKKIIKDGKGYKIKSHKRTVDFVIAVHDSGYILPIPLTIPSKSQMSLTKVCRFIDCLI